MVTPCWPRGTSVGLGATWGFATLTEKASMGLPIPGTMIFPTGACSLLVLSCKARGPSFAVGSILMTAVASVAECTVNETAAMPAPKSAVVVPCWKEVFFPANSTVAPCCPCGTLLGVAVTVGGKVVTVLVGVVGVPGVSVAMRGVAGAVTRPGAAIGLTGTLPRVNSQVQFAISLEAAGCIGI